MSKKISHLMSKKFKNYQHITYILYFLLCIKHLMYILKEVQIKSIAYIICARLAHLNFWTKGLNLRNFWISRGKPPVCVSSFTKYGRSEVFSLHFRSIPGGKAKFPCVPSFNWQMRRQTLYFNRSWPHIKVKISWSID